MSVVPICMVIDDRYVPFAATTLLSVCGKTAAEIDCYILAHNVSESRKEMFDRDFQSVQNVHQITWIDVNDDLLSGLEAGRHISLVTYARIFIPDLVPKEKVIFTDVDVLVQGDIEELYKEELTGYLLGAVPEDDAEDGHVEDKARLEIPEEAFYFNAGLLLINSLEWRKEGWTSKLLNDAKKNKEKLKYYDQDLLNKNLYFSCKPLNKKWSWLRQRARSVEANKVYLSSPGIRHFNGRTKPWLCFPWGWENGERLGTREFWFVAQRTNFFDEICAVRASKGKLVRLLGKNFAKKFVTFLLKL